MSKSSNKKYQSTSQCEIIALRRIWELLEQGQTPSFLEMMAAISEMVAFYTNSDSARDAMDEKFFCMSGKKCRFCD